MLQFSEVLLLQFELFLLLLLDVDLALQHLLLVGTEMSPILLVSLRVDFVVFRTDVLCTFPFNVGSEPIYMQGVIQKCNTEKYQE